jgi:hypothetical protein
MTDRVISLRLPDELDELIRCSGIGLLAPDVTDDIRRLYVVALLAAVVNGLEAPIVADALVQLNGGYTLLQDRKH